MAPERRSWLRSKPISDEEFVEQIRRQVAASRRWRGWLIALYSALGVAFVVLSISAANQAAELIQLFVNRWIVFSGFGIGLLLGLMLGQMGHKIGFGLVSALSSPRTEELLLQYHDRTVEFTCEDPELAEELQSNA